MTLGSSWDVFASSHERVSWVFSFSSVCPFSDTLLNCPSPAPHSLWLLTTHLIPQPPLPLPLTHTSPDVNSGVPSDPSSYPEHYMPKPGPCSPFRSLLQCPLRGLTLLTYVKQSIFYLLFIVCPLPTLDESKNFVLLAPYPQCLA